MKVCCVNSSKPDVVGYQLALFILAGLLVLCFLHLLPFLAQDDPEVIADEAYSEGYNDGLEEAYHRYDIGYADGYDNGYKDACKELGVGN